MKAQAKHLWFLLTICCFLTPSIHSQNVSVGFPGLEDYYRRAQLMGQIDSTFSFCARPFNPVATLGINNPFDPDGSLEKTRLNTWDGTAKFMSGKWLIMALPQSIQVAYKRPVPISMNDGPMIPAKGFQTLYTGGVYTELGPLSIRFQPEFLYAENKAYKGFLEESTNKTWVAYYGIYNYIDLPEQFGEGPYQRNMWGQSSIRLNFGPVSFGLSNENLWWGPGYRNTLLMTNSAPGFKHLTLNTRKPIKTPIGSFEGQLFGGKLEGSGYLPPSLYRDNIGARYIIPKKDDWRYFNGITLSYTPKWVPGLFVGVSRAAESYSELLKQGFRNYFPVLLPILVKEDYSGDAANHLMSGFVRWVFLKEKAEVYFEYGREDRSADMRDLLIDLTHTRAYVLGLRKLFPLSNKSLPQQIEVGIEVTQLENIKTRRVGGTSTWYTHSLIRHGYTNVGQMLGAGIGPGSNLQTLDVSWNQGLKKIGIRIERYVHNNDLRYKAVLDTRRHWVDFIGTAIGTWDYKNFIFSAQIDAVKSINYQWYYNPWENLVNVVRGTGEEFWAHGKDVYSLQALIGVTYRF